MRVLKETIHRVLVEQIGHYWNKEWAIYEKEEDDGSIGAMEFHTSNKEQAEEIWQRKMSVDGNLIEIGNLVELQDDTISVGIGNGAEITEVVIEDNYITQIITDGQFDVDDASLPRRADS